MCAVSVIYDMFGKQPDSWYTLPRIDLFHSMVSAAKTFDIEINQPDCEDAEKAKVLDRISELENELNNRDIVNFTNERNPNER